MTEVGSLVNDTKENVLVRKEICPFVLNKSYFVNLSVLIIKFLYQMDLRIKIFVHTLPLQA